MRASRTSVLVAIALAVAVVGMWQLFARTEAGRYNAAHKVQQSRSEIRIDLAIVHDKGPLTHESYAIADIDGVSSVTYSATNRAGTTVHVTAPPPHDKRIRQRRRVSVRPDRAGRDLGARRQAAARRYVDALHDHGLLSSSTDSHGSHRFTFTDPHYWATTGGHQFHITLDRNKPVPDLVTLKSTVSVEPRYGKIVDDIETFGSPGFPHTVAAKRALAERAEMRLARRRGRRGPGRGGLPRLQVGGGSPQPTVRQDARQRSARRASRRAHLRRRARTRRTPTASWTCCATSTCARRSSSSAGRSRRIRRTVRRIARDGNALGNHTWDHQHLLALPARAVDAELARTDDAIFRATGTRTRLMRPPFGARDFDSLGQARQRRLHGRHVVGAAAEGLGAAGRRDDRRARDRQRRRPAASSCCTTAIVACCAASTAVTAARLRPRAGRRGDAHDHRDAARARLPLRDDPRVDAGRASARRRSRIHPSP